jgi:hypothetical protein
MVMKTLTFRRNRKSAAFGALLLAAIGSVVVSNTPGLRAGTINVTGTPGTSGLPGNPGGAGGNGGYANAAANSTDSTNAATANSGIGGAGGNGNVSGASGGYGGGGGTAAAFATNIGGGSYAGTVSSSASAYGGAGGNSGQPFAGSTNPITLITSGGGAATASAGAYVATANSVSVQAGATSGNGGNGLLGANAGGGGYATAIVNGSVTAVGSSAPLTLTGSAVGGKGGDVSGGAYGSVASPAILRGPFACANISSSAAYAPVAGQGGYAAGLASGVTYGNGPLNVSVNLHGGDGGNVTSGAGHGGYGGYAIVNNGSDSGVSYGGGDVSVTLSVTGGNGGNASTSGLPGKAGDGAYENYITSISSRGQSSSVNGSIDVIKEADGSYQGAAAIIGGTSGTLSLTQNVIAGSGGAASYGAPGFAGGAESSLLVDAAYLPVIPHDLNITATATGGNGGTLYRSSGSAASGGGSSSYTNAVNGTGSAAAAVSSIGGAGGTGYNGAAGGYGGVAFATAYATIASNGLSVCAGTISPGQIVHGGSGGEGINGSSAGNGAYAHGIALAQATGNSQVSAVMSVQGGAGGDVSGPGNGTPGYGGDARAASFGYSNGGQVTVSAQAIGGQSGEYLSGALEGNVPSSNGWAIADAAGQGADGSVSAFAVSAGGLFSGVQAIAVAPVISNSTSGAESFANVNGPVRPESAGAGENAIAYVTGLPGIGNDLAAITLAAWSLSNQSADYHSEVDLTLNVSQFLDQQEDLYLGLFGANYTGDGADNGVNSVSFTIQANGITLPESLNNASFNAAANYFNNGSLNLGSVWSLTDTNQLNLQFILDVTMSQNTAGFDPSLVFSNGAPVPVPEPAGLSILAAGSVILLIRRIKYKNK